MRRFVTLQSIGRHCIQLRSLSRRYTSGTTHLNKLVSNNNGAVERFPISARCRYISSNFSKPSNPNNRNSPNNHVLLHFSSLPSNNPSNPSNPKDNTENNPSSPDSPDSPDDGSLWSIDGKILKYTALVTLSQFLVSLGFGVVVHNP